MRTENVVPATENMLPELIPFLAAIQKEYSVETACQFEKLFSDCSILILNGDKRYDQYSLLTSGGYPMELTLRSDTNDLYVTTEAGSSNDKIEQHLFWAQQYSSSFSFVEHPLLEQFNKSNEQRYGCWLGIRFKGSKPSYKLYHEATEATAKAFLKELSMLYGLDKLLPELIPMMAGFIPGIKGIAEFYCRIPKSSLVVLHHFFSMAGVASELNMFLDYLGWLGGMSREELFSRLRFGVSFQQIAGQLPGISIFIHMSELCRNNLKARSRLLSFAKQLGYQMPFYESVSARLLIENPTFPVHGIISFKPMPKGKMIFSVGLRPW